MKAASILHSLPAMDGHRAPDPTPEEEPIPAPHPTPDKDPVPDHNPSAARAARATWSA